MIELKPGDRVYINFYNGPRKPATVRALLIQDHPYPAYWVYEMELDSGESPIRVLRCDLELMPSLIQLAEALND